MKQIFAVLAFVCLVVLTNTPAKADGIATSITRYQVEAYGNASGSDKLGIIRLYADNSTNVVAYLHFHRTTSTMPSPRVSVDAANRVHAHYLSGDWANFLKLLDGRGTLRFTYDAKYKNVYVTRDSTVTP